MTKEELNSLEYINDELICAKDLDDKSDRTLMYGYTYERETFHVYVCNNQIFTIIYRTGGIQDARIVDVKSNEQYIPSKRAYPECCDYDFCRMLKERGCRVPFISWDSERADIREVRQYYGEILETSKVALANL